MRREVRSIAQDLVAALRRMLSDLGKEAVISTYELRGRPWSFMNDWRLRHAIGGLQLNKIIVGFRTRVMLGAKLMPLMCGAKPLAKICWAPRRRIIWPA